MDRFPIFFFFFFLLAVASANWCTYHGNRQVCAEQPYYVDPSWSTPEECRRECREGEEPRTCYFNFVLEPYTSNSPACNLSSTDGSECIRMDGVERPLLTINRRLPGPPIEVCLYDKVIIDVDNRMEGADVTIHWHGIFQNLYQYYDGVPFLTQCPILSGNTFRYQFQLLNSGTHLYHTHVGLQIILGLYGSFIVRRPITSEPYGRYYLTDNTVILISDFMNDCVSPGKYPGFVKRSPGQAADGILCNGLGYNLNRSDLGSPAVFPLEPGPHRIRLINIMSTVCVVEVTIEEHSMYIIAQDGDDCKPRKADKIQLASGERVDLLVNLTSPILKKFYWIHMRGLDECEETKIYQVAALSYAGANVDLTSRQRPTYDTKFATGNIVYNPNDATNCYSSENELCVSELESDVDTDLLVKTPTHVWTLTFGFEVDDNSQIFTRHNYEFPRYFLPPSDGIAYRSTVNNVSFTFPPSPPLLQKYYCKSTTWCPGYCEGFNSYDCKLYDVVDVILVDVLGIPVLHHPFHFHGHNFCVLDVGMMNTTSIDGIQRKHRWRVANKAYTRCSKKDTVKVPAGAYVILRIYANNPGWWLFHCHFLWHTATGMDFVIHVGDDKRQLPPVPPDFPMCYNYRPPPTWWTHQDVENYWSYQKYVY